MAHPGQTMDDRRIIVADDRLDQGQCVVKVAHQRRAGGAAGDLLGRAAHVDVDDARAHAFDDAGGFGHWRCFAPCQLHGS